MILQCMVEYKKVKNWTFLLNWLGAGQEEKKDYVAKVVGHELPAILEYAFNAMRKRSNTASSKSSSKSLHIYRKNP